MREWIKSLSGGSEFLLITIICFTYAVAASTITLLLRIQRLELSTQRALRGAAFEVVLLLAAGWILHVRGWRFREVAGRLSLASALAGIPLFVGYILLYWFVAVAVALLFPSVAGIRPFQIVHTASPAAIMVFFVVNSFYEEFAVTGYVIRALEGKGPAFSISASTLIRFLYHP